MVLRLRWTPAQVVRARDQYLENAGDMIRERHAFAGGSRIAAGEIDLRDFYAIVDWKSPRPKSGIQKGNTQAEIVEALRVAGGATHARTAVAVLCGLYGVDVRMASAILTAMRPERYTVIDVRALNALGVEKSWTTVDDYLEYLAFCRVKAAERALSLRDLDRALWILGGAAE